MYLGGDKVWAMKGASVMVVLAMVLVSVIMPVVTGDSLFEVAVGEGDSGAGTTSNFGWNVSKAGDINGDGVDDLIIGAPNADYNSVTDCGAAFIYFGYDGIQDADLNASNANVSIYGTTASGHFGWDIADAGDVNGASNADVIIGEPDNGNGKAYVYYGSGSMTATMTTASADVTITGEASGDKFGISVAGAGNYDNSGNSDVIIGAPDADSGKGRAYIFYGDGSIPTTAATADVILKGKNTDGSFGTSVSSAGNTDGNVGDEIVIGEPGEDKAFIFYEPEVKNATSETSTSGIVTPGTDGYQKTQDSDDDYEIIEEAEGSGGSGVTDTVMVYGQGSNADLTYSLWDDPSGSWGTDTSSGTFASDSEHVVAYSNPTRNEVVTGAICGTNTAPDSIYVNVWDGESDTWGTPLEVTATSPIGSRYRPYDIAFESQSGDAVIFYGDGGSTFAYRVWDGSSWSGESTYTLSNISGTIYWIEAASDPHSDEISILITDSASDAQGVIWSGSACGDQQLLSTSLPTTLYQPHDVEYEQDSGYAMFVWGELATDIHYRQWSGTAWDASNSLLDISTQGGISHWISLNPDPTSGSDKLVLTVIDTVPGLHTARWSGSGWTVDAVHDTVVERDYCRCADAIYETAAGHEGHIFLVWGDGSNTGAWKHFDGTSWSASPTIVDGAGGADGFVIQLRGDANDTIHLSILVQITTIVHSWTWDGSSLTYETAHTGANPDDDRESFMVAPGVAMSDISKMEHKWPISINGYENTFNLEANRTNYDSDDAIKFYYSLTGTGTVGTTGWTEMLTVTKTTDDDSYQTFSDDTLSAYTGTVYVGMANTNLSSGSITVDAVYIDDMYFSCIPYDELLGEQSFASTDYITASDSAVTGTVSGTHASTQSTDDTYESITEVASSATYDSDYTASETFTESDSNTLTHTATQAQDGTTEDIVELSVGGSSSTTEIRYMRSDSATVNGLTADSLSTTQSTTAQTTTLTSTTIIYAGIRVWKRDSGGTETEITSGTAVAIASATSTAIVSGTWSCPQTALAATDSIVVRWYADGATPPTNLIQDFTTEQLGATQLDANTWTVYYYLSERQNGDSVSWGTSTANTRVEDFKWSASVSPYYSLEHEWQFDATPVSASQYEFQAHVGWDSAGAGDDTFTYYYSTTGSDPVGTGDWVEMFTDTTQALNTLTFDLDADGYTGGAFYVGVIDTASSGDGQDTLEVDYLRVYTTVTPASNSLEHKWTISVPSSGTDSTFYVEAYRTDLDSENFELYYSTTGSGSVSTWTSMFDITKTTDDDSYQQHSDATLDAFDGTLYIGVIDASTVDSSLDTVYVDHMYLRVGGALIPSNFGSIVSSAGDINDDGKDDILVGAPEASNGEVYLYYGGASASSGSITNTTQSDFTESGSSLASSNPNNNIYATSTGELNLTGTGGWSSTSMYANYETGGDVGAYIYDAQWIAQPFDVDAGDTFRLTNVSLYVNDMGASDSMTIEIRIDDAGSPGLGAGNLLGTQTIDGDNVDSWQDFTFGSPLALTGGSKYWICVSNTNAVDTDSYTWELMDGGTYSAGTICLSSDQGTSWGSQLAYAAYFRAYGQLDTAIYSTPGYYTSSESSTSASITGIKPYWNLTTPAGTTAWIDISRDGGTTWNQSGLTNGAWYSFPTEASGDQLCYQVTMKATDNTVTPVLQDLTIYYNLSTIAASITGASSGDKFGFSVTGAGDIDGDGIDDILIGAPGNDTADGSKANGGGVFAFCGGAYLSGDVSASSANFTYYGETAGDMLGYSVGPIGDVNSYGDDDIVVGAPYYDSSAGKAYVLSVALPMTNAVTFTVEEHGLNPESKVNLSWSGMNGALKYNVYRSENPWGFDFDTPTATINAPTTSWTDESASRNTTNAHNATTYYYAIKAENYLAEKGPFTITAIHRLDLVPGWNLVTWLSNETKDIETGAFANLEADDGTNPTTYIYDKVERWHPDTQVWESYTTDGDLGNFSDMEAGYAYAIQCRVSAIWSFGEDCGAPVFSTADDAVLNAPGSFTLARNDTNADYVDLDWDTVASADHYNIYRSYCKWGFDFNAPIHTTTDTWWNDTTATQENGAYNTSVYYYIVRAVDASGNIEKNLNVVGMHRMDLMTGIDYISWTIHKTETTANALDSLTQFTDYISVARWNESGQAFDTSVSSFERGYGYGIYTLQACTWTYIEYAA